METIAPLAKVLAEANGIEWRSLHGTGNAGMITETDILGYLARVMSGEEDAPTTPVDPMPSPAELAVYSSPEMLSRAGVEPELAEFLKAQQDQIQHVQTQHSAPPEVVAPPALSMSAPDVAVPDISVPDISVPSVSMPSAAMSDLAAPDLVVPEVTAAEIVLEPVVPAPITPEPITPEPITPSPAFEVQPAAEDDFAEPAFIHTPAPEPEDEFELEEEPVEAKAPAAQAQPVTPPPLPQAPAKPASGGLLSGLLSSLYRRSDPPAPQAPAQLTPTQPTPTQSTPTRPVAATPAVSLPEVIKPAVLKPDVKLPELGVPPAAALALPEPELAVHADVVPPISAESRAEERVLPPAPVLGEVIVPDSTPPAGSVQPTATAEPTDTAEPAPFVPSEPEVAPMPLPAPQMPSVAPAATLPNITVPAAAWAGTYLRREVDLSAVQSAREQLSDLVGDLPLTLMLARAAQRHLGLLGLSSVAVANVSGQALGADLSGDLRSGIKALSDAKPASSKPASSKPAGSAELLILDAGELDLDDLHYPHAVTLSLGRVQNGKSALSLNGDLDVQQAARFLAEVSALLAAPVKLLV